MKISTVSAVTKSCLKDFLLMKKTIMKKNKKDKEFFEKVTIVALVSWFLITAAIGVAGALTKLLE